MTVTMPTKTRRLCSDCHHTPSRRIADHGAECCCRCHDVADAAPQMLAACEAVIAESNMGIDAANPDDWHAAEITRGAIEMVEAAVVVAKGGVP